MVGTATLISLFAGVCYCYTLHYRAAYLGRLGLDPVTLPVSMQEAIAMGFEGIVANVLWVLALLAVGTLGCIALAWGGGYALQTFFPETWHLMEGENTTSSADRAGPG